MNNVAAITQPMPSTAGRARAGAFTVPPAKAKEALKLKQATQDFESLFVTYMLNQMSNTVFKSEMLPESTAQSIFKDMYNQELAKVMSKTGSFGIANMLYKQMVRRL